MNILKLKTVLDRLPPEWDDFEICFLRQATIDTNGNWSGLESDITGITVDENTKKIYATDEQSSRVMIDILKDTGNSHTI